MKYYWLKFERGFYKRHDIILIKKKFGSDGFYAYMVLLFESIDHAGELRFSEDTPYTIEDLAILTGTDEEMFGKLFEYMLSKSMIVIADDGTILMKYAQQNLESETDSARRMRKYRKNESIMSHSDADVQNGDANVQNSDTEKETESEKEIEEKILAEKLRQSELRKKVDNWFSYVWKMYPNKKGKAAISLTTKQKLYKKREQFEKAIRRYVLECRGREERYIMYGSSFFNKGWIDYIDENYERSDGVPLLTEEQEQLNKVRESRQKVISEDSKKMADEKFEEIKKKYPELEGKTEEELIAITMQNIKKVKSL